jgi:hypothetical protein
MTVRGSLAAVHPCYANGYFEYGTGDQARRNGRASSCLTATGGGLPWFNYLNVEYLTNIVG